MEDYDESSDVEMVPIEEVESRSRTQPQVFTINYQIHHN